LNLKDRVVRSIKRRKGVVILSSEVASLGSPSSISKVLSSLVRDGTLVRVSRGVYAKTRFNKFTGGPTPAGTSESIAAETFRKLGIEVFPGRLARDYNAGLTTQIPMEPVVCTGRRRITRKITVGSRTVKYERPQPPRIGTAVPPPD
jgi:predicted transcriptional regulator of viral defense system